MSWISENRSDVTFVVSIVLGSFLCLWGVFDRDPATLALGAGAIGLKGFSGAANHKKGSDGTPTD